MDDTFIDAPQLATRSMGGGGGGGPSSSTRHGETSVTPIPLYKSIRNPWPTTVQAVLGFYKNIQNINPTNPRVHNISIRLNSIIDCLTTGTPVTGDAAAAAQTPDAGNNIQYPMWRDYYFNFYQYWTVVACEYRIKIYFDSPVVNNGTQLACYFYHHGRDGPPITVAGGAAAIPHYIRAQHPNVSWQFVNPKEVLVRDAAADVEHFGHNANTNYAEYRGIWRPGMTPHSVVEDEFQKIWVKPLEMPPQIEKLTIITQPGPEDKGTGDNKARTIDINLKYHVQFKDLKQKYHYVTQETTMDAVTTGFAIRDDVALITS